MKGEGGEGGRGGGGVMGNEHDLPEMHQEIDVKASHVRNDRINMKLMDDPVSYRIFQISFLIG